MDLTRTISVDQSSGHSISTAITSVLPIHLTPIDPIRTISAIDILIWCNPHQ